MSVEPSAGLRERKKVRTRALIRSEAFRLFREQGYPETTIDQIAAAADVSPSTFFRYFPTKEQLVIVDDLDPVMMAAIEAQPPDVPLIRAFKIASETVFAQMSKEDFEVERDRQELMYTVPELRLAMMQELVRTIDMVSEVMAKRVGRAEDDIEIRTLAGAIIGAVLAVIDKVPGDIPRAVTALEYLEAGLPLGQATKESTSRG
ncbi:acyl-CoA-like ligand-binding transcription factor [Antrihabitans cavernicola]|uniref:TetR family transcriptional regulator n=1 Tax=Antrihabitans cavernicola TaxID=2495913 RepID=A0A5A7S954_9NOCA|nr:TetR family transcriptional regulator [Spelaeibacter cavernicola]KAA0022688.1 TetR family transcriptional regulator [Spelaeibacter cavernicola]